MKRQKQKLYEKKEEEARRREKEKKRGGRRERKRNRLTDRTDKRSQRKGEKDIGN